MFFQIVSIVFPIFGVIVVGYLYGRRRRPDMIATNQVNMDIFVPALIFSALVGRSFEFAEVRMIAIGGALIVLGSGLLGWPVARLAGCSPKTLLPPMMFKNAGNMGLPLLLLAFGDKVLPAAVILFLIESVMHFSIGTYWLGHNVNIWRLFRDPVFAAGTAGVLVSMSGVALWPPFMSAMKIIGDVSTGLMLFSLGVRLNTAPFAEWRIGAVGAIATPVTGMLVAWVFCVASGLSSAEKDVLLLFGALPPAVLNFMFAERYGQEPQKVASIVIMGNLAALVAISAALAIRLSS
ncbi:MAG TPA: AEC family transporter [Aromatoleum sp.]|uniref:AEC family transporter n=1 Tax=Aromatoleum sp. TaxID=2307007 RepID=UPI002B47172C|nr:AEC family transporter [Aromatoleum sp.]HJV25180.1 AEC family transporter [Aromatoleum sp.]